VVPETSKAGRREWIGLGVIALPCLLYAMDLTVLNLAVPSLSADLKPSSAQLLWIVDIYGFMVAGMLIPMGALGDRIGRRRLLLIGAAAFGIASVLAAFARSAEMLIAVRAVLGIAGATVAPSTLSLIRNMFHDSDQRTFAIGVWISSYSAGAAIGPVLGGVLLEHFWWGSVFLLGVPVMVLLLAVGPTLLPEYRDPNPGPLDLPSAALSLASVLTTIYGLKRIAEDGLAWLPAMTIVAGIGIAVVFVRRQTASANPMIDLRLFRQPAFTGALLTYLLGTFVAFGVFIFVAQHMQLVLGMTPLTAGLWTTPFAAGFIVGSMLTPRIVRRVSPSHLMCAGLVLAAVGFAVLAGAGTTTSPVVLVIAFVLYSLGLAPVFTLATDQIVGAAPPERAGAAAAISETGSEFGGALGIAILGSIGTAVYRRAMASGVPAGVPPEAETAARMTLGAAVEVSQQLGGMTGAALLEASRSAFDRGMQLAAWTAAAAMIGTAYVAARMPPSRKQEPEARGLGRPTGLEPLTPGATVQPDTKQ
jgi:DHA2 family multidrug resistance protein-like MFS transporter